MALGPRQRSFHLLALAAALLLGQAAGLHHEHASGADCPPEACLHLDGVAAHAEPAARWVEQDACPLCDLLSHGRRTMPAPALEAHEPVEGPVRPSTGQALSHAPAAPRSGAGPRAPPLAA